MLDKKLLS